MSIEAVRELHAPTETLDCYGCDIDGYEAEAPMWPCRTAVIVYTPEEIADAQEASAFYLKWRRQALLRNRSLAPRNLSLIQRAYEQYVEQSLRAQPFFRSLAVPLMQNDGTYRTLTFSRDENLGTVIKVAR